MIGLMSLIKMLARKLRLDQIASKLKEQRVLMRVDFNVPLKNGKVADLTRITSTLESIKFVLDSGAKSLVLMSHLGRPDGKVVEKYSLSPVVPELSKLLNTHVEFLNDCVGSTVESFCANPKHGSVILLENLRFHIEEEGSVKKEDGTKVKADQAKVAEFRKSLTSLGDIYINDAFGTAHRAHSSMVGVNLPIRAAGHLMSKELEYFSKVLENPKKPLLVILGGAKVKDKIQLINNLIDKCDEMIIGGGMAFTFKKQLENYSIGKSIYDADGAKIVDKIFQHAKDKGVKIHLPVDFVCGDSIEENCNTQTVETSIPDGWLGLDIGPKSVEIFKQVINRAATIVWNGPPGMFEHKKFRSASEEFLKAIANRKKDGITSIVGGGDTASFVQSIGSQDISHISTGGGASLELLEGKELPGIVALSDK
jgi:phosphoglycerate kinase